MISEKEYRLLCRIRDEGEAFDPIELSKEEKNILDCLMDKGYVERHLRSEQSKEQFQNRKVVLNKDTGSKAEGAEKHIEPELNPGTLSVFTPTFLSRLLLSGLLGFVAGSVFSYLLKRVFVL